MLALVGDVAGAQTRDDSAPLAADDSAPVVADDPAPVAAAQARVPTDDLALALERATYLFDPVVYLGASRELLTAVFEGVCAAHYLIPPEDGLDWGLGIGCLLGATTLAVMSMRQFRRPRSERVAHERLAAFRAEGPRLSEERVHHYEDWLREGAERGRRRRLVGGVYGVLNFVATVVLGVLVGRDRIPRNGGVAIASGTFAIGVLGVANFGVRSADEKAWERFLRE